MPIAGKVIEINEDLLKEPTLVNTESFGRGWMIKIHIANEDEVNELLTDEQYKSIVI